MSFRYATHDAITIMFQLIIWSYTLSSRRGWGLLHKTAPTVGAFILFCIMVYDLVTVGYLTMQKFSWNKFGEMISIYYIVLVRAQLHLWYRRSYIWSGFTVSVGVITFKK